MNTYVRCVQFAHFHLVMARVYALFFIVKSNILDCISSACDCNSCGWDAEIFYVHQLVCARICQFIHMAFDFRFISFFFFFPLCLVRLVSFDSCVPEHRSICNLSTNDWLLLVTAHQKCKQKQINCQQLNDTLRLQTSFYI